MIASDCGDKIKHIDYSNARSVLFLELLSQTHARTLNGSFTVLLTYHKDLYLF